MPDGIDGNFYNNSYTEILENTCNQYNKTLGKNKESIFDALQGVCSSLNANDLTLGTMYGKFCSAIKALVTKITTSLARFAFDLAAKFVNFFKKEGISVDNNRHALVKSVESMADSAKYDIPINEKNGLAYKYMNNGKPEYWCADTVRTFFLGIPGIDPSLSKPSSEGGIGNIHSVQGFMDWGKEIYKETSRMKQDERADYIINNVKPGDIMIQKRNGTSHTGIVVEIYPDGYTDPDTGIEYPPGSFRTVEGNASDELRYIIYPPNHNKLSGFIDMSQYLDNLDTSVDEQIPNTN